MALDATELSIYIKMIDQASGVARQIEGSVNSLGNSFSKVSQNALGFASGIAAVAGVSSAIDAIGGVVVGFNSKLEQSTIAWTTFTGNADAARAVIQQIQQIAAVTPFEFADVDRAAKRFVNAGFSAQEALNFITPLSNAVAAVGLSAEGVDRVSLALAQMTQKTRVQGQEMLQLTEAQIPAWDILAQATGKPIPELQKLVTAGQITAKEFTDAFAQYYGATGKFANAAHDQSLTFQGSMSTIRDELNIVGSTAFQPLFKALSDGARAFAAFVQSDQFVVWGARIQAVVGLVVDGLGGLSSAFSSTLGGVLDIVSTVGQAIYGALQWINPFASHSPPLVSQVQDGVAAIRASYETLGGVSGTFDTVRAAFENLNGVTANFSATFGDDLPTKVEKALAIMGPGATDAFNSASAAIDAAKASVADIKTEWDSATAALVPLKDSLDAAKDSLKDQQTTLSGLKSQLSDAKAAYDPLNQQLKDVQQNAKDAEQAIKDLTNAPIAGTAGYDKQISSGNIALKEQELTLSRLKQSDSFASLGTQIDTATAKLKEMQRTQAAFIPNLPTGASKGQQEAHAKAIEQNRELADQQRRAITDQQVALDALKAKQQDLLDPAQKELAKRRESLDALRLEKDATIGVAQERIKAAAAEASGVKERTEQQILAAIGAAKAARDAALGQEATLSPQVKAQEDAIKGMESAIRSQEHAVADAQKTVDAANTTYSDAKTLVDDLGSAYRSGKSEIAGYDQQLKQLIQTGELQIQKAAEAKKAADAATKAAALAGRDAPKTPVLAGLDIEGSQKKLQAFSDQVGATRAQITGHLDAVRGMWETAWSAVSAVLDKALVRFGGFTVLQPAIDFLTRFAGAAAGLGAALVIATPIIGLLGAALAPIGVLVAAALSPLGLLVVGIAALAAAWTLNVGNIQQSAGGLFAAFAPLQDLPAIMQKAFGGDVTGALNDFVVVLQSVRGKVIATLAGWAAAFVDWLLPQLPALTTQLTTFASAIIGWILGQGDKFVANLLAWGTAFVNWLTPRIPDILTALSGVGLQILQWIRDQGTIIASRLGEWAAAFITWVIPLLPQIGTAIKQIATAVIDFIALAVPTILGALVDWAGAFLGWVVPLIPDLLGALLGLLGELTVWIIEVGLPKIVGVLGNWGAAFLDWIGPRIVPMLEEAGKLLDRLARWIIEKAPDVAAKVGQWGAAFLDWIATTVLPKLGAALDTIINGGNGFVGIVPWIKAQADAFPENLAYWVTKFVLWIDDVVKALPAKLAKMVTAIKDWVTSDGARDIAVAALPLGEALAKGIVLGLFAAPFLISKGILDAVLGAIPEAKKGIDKALSERNGGGGGGGGGAGGLGGASGNSAVAGASSVAGWDPKAVESYIRETARKYGIDPQTAARVAGSEGLNNPVGDHGMSFGPFQLYTGGGLGNQFQQQTGLNPADFQNNWQQQVDFALNWAKQHGWNPGGERTATGATGGGFHGATAAGIGNWEGINTSVKEAAPALDNLSTQVDSVSNDVLQSIPHLKDYGFTIQSLADSTAPAGAALDDLATQTGKPRGAFLELAQSAQTGLGATVDAATAFADQFGISLEQADKIIQDHGAVAKAVLATDIPGSFDKADLAVEQFANAFGINWDQARAILESSGAVSDLVMGKQIPAAAQTTIDAIAGVGDNKMWQVIDSNAAIAAKSLKTYLQDSGAASINVATASLGDLEKASGLTLPQIQTQAQGAGKDLKTWLQDTGVPAARELAKHLGVDGVAGAADSIKKPVDDATSATKNMGGAMDVAASTQIAAVLLDLRDGLLGTGSHSQGGGLIQAVKDFSDALNKIPTDIHVSITADQVGGLKAGVAGATPAQFAQSGISEGTNRNAPSSSSSNISPFPDHIGESGPGGKYNDPSTGKPYTRAGGGPVSAGQLYQVNEHGAHAVELFMPAMSGYVGPKGSGPQSSGATGGIDYPRLAAAIAKAMENQPAPRVAVEDIRSELWAAGRRNGGVVGLA